MIKPLRFNLQDSNRASDEWQFNCGPAALCAILNLTPDEIRSKMGDFEKKGYSNPTLVFDTLKRCGADYRMVFRRDEPTSHPVIDHGLVRVQWSGPWTKPGVPMRVRYRKTHWAAVREKSTEAFDVNAMMYGGWLPYLLWSSKLIPWLIKECVPKGDGGWWITHGIEVTPK